MDIEHEDEDKLRKEDKTAAQYHNEQSSRVQKGKGLKQCPQSWNSGLEFRSKQHCKQSG